VFAIVWLVLLWGAPGVEFYLGSPDHGLQLMTGQQVVRHGKVLFVDLFNHYGPLTSYTSAVGLILHHSLLPETLICAAGYAAALTILFAVARRLSGWPAALGVLVACLLLLARFYKWYYWLFPALTILLLMRSMRFVAPARRYLPLGILLTQWPRQSVGRWAASAALTCLGFAAPLAVFCAWLVAQGGPSAVAGYFASFLSTSRGFTRSLSIAPPPLSTWLAVSPLNPEFGRAFCFHVLPLIAGLGLLICASAVLKYRLRLGGRLWGCTCLGALGFFPQALWRADLPHLTQVLPLFALTVAILLGWLAHWETSWGRWPARLAAAGLSASLILPLMALRPVWAVDLHGFHQPVAAKFRALAHPFELPTPAPEGQLCEFIRAHSNPHDALLVLSYHVQTAFFADRPLAGLLPGYAPGFLTADAWQQRNLNRVGQDDPRLVILAEGCPIDGRPENEVSQFAPRLFEFVEREYPHTAFRAGPFSVRVKR
jgi:hypothetical protein